MQFNIDRQRENHEKMITVLSGIQYNLGIVIFFTGILAIILGYILSRSIARPLKKLQDASLEIGRGNHDIEVAIKSGGELGQLAEAFNTMVVELKVARDRMLGEITERKLAEGRLQYLVYSSPTVIYTCVNYGDYHATYMSNNIEKLLGYTANDFLETPTFWVDHIHPDDKERVKGYMSNHPGKNSYSLEYRFLHKNGSYRWMHDQISLVVDSKGTPGEIVGSWSDITEQKQIDREERRATVSTHSLSEDGLARTPYRRASHTTSITL